MAVIDVHTHMLTRDYLDLLETHGAPDYTRSLNPAGQETILRKGAPFFTLSEPMWDYEMRIRDMDLAGVDLAIVSLTCPNAYFGDAETSLRAARNVNDSMSEQQTARPDRIRWLASLPWQYPELALQELAVALKIPEAPRRIASKIAAEVHVFSMNKFVFAPIYLIISLTSPVR